ncbi:hypothetical protein HD554DRAFT_725165 [Boletus coccyginus]|nr:hypothetical protein HD554DRAFT_725165 [Boletus coccyginus]
MPRGRVTSFGMAADSTLSWALLDGFGLCHRSPSAHSMALNRHVAVLTTFGRVQFRCCYFFFHTRPFKLVPHEQTGQNKISYPGIRTGYQNTVETAEGRLARDQTLLLADDSTTHTVLTDLCGGPYSNGRRFVSAGHRSQWWLVHVHLLVGSSNFSEISMKHNGTRNNYGRHLVPTPSSSRFGLPWGYSAQLERASH